MHRTFAMTAWLLSVPAVGMAQSSASAPSFEVASVKRSPRIVGRDGTITSDPGRFVARNATLKRLIFEAWQVPYAQIVGGPAWLNSDEYEVEAKPAGRANAEQLRLMLRTLLVDRFHLRVRNEKRDGRIYELRAEKRGLELHPAGDGGNGLPWRFHGDLNEFANRLAVQLTIPMVQDPATPAMARGTQVPVVNQTGIEGTYDIVVNLQPEQGGDPFTMWQRALHEQLGLKLEARKAALEYLVIDSAERSPGEN